jgi:ADP-ribose pyrophosphatase YjhB (NUDIX family)
MRQYPDAPRIGIGIVVLDGPRTLLIRRAKPPGAGTWSLPGGAQELGETAEACARRELREETALNVGDLILAAHVDSIHHDAAGRLEYHYTILDFCARYAGGTAVPGSDVTALTWATPDEFDALALWPPARAVIAKALTLLPP